MNVAPPNTGPGAGRVIAGIREGSANTSSPASDPVTLQLNESIREFRLLAAQALLATPSQPQTALFVEEAEAAFYGPDRFLEWPRLGSPAAVLEANRAAIGNLRAILRGETPRLPEDAGPGARSGGS